MNRWKICNRRNLFFWHLLLEITVTPCRCSADRNLRHQFLEINLPCFVAFKQDLVLNVAWLLQYNVQIWIGISNSRSYIFNKFARRMKLIGMTLTSFLQAFIANSSKPLPSLDLRAMGGCRVHASLAAKCGGNVDETAAKGDRNEYQSPNWFPW